MNFDITASIVLYKNDIKLLNAAINSFLQTKLHIKLYLIDNSPTDSLKNISDDERVSYIHNPANPGFGAGHNVAIIDIQNNTKYHLVLNPDIYFGEGVVEKIVDYMDSHKDVGVVMPLIQYPDGQIQYLAKLLPTPQTFILRRFIPFKKVVKKSNEEFELRMSGYNHIMEAPFLSGCFLVFQQNALLNINGFDGQIFMYTEDIDICRRIIEEGYKCIFYPEVIAYHDHERKSFLKLRTLKVYLKSAIYYFNKWGWIFDKQRDTINKKTLSQFRK